MVHADHRISRAMRGMAAPDGHGPSVNQADGVPEMRMDMAAPQFLHCRTQVPAKFTGFAQDQLKLWGS